MRSKMNRNAGLLGICHRKTYITRLRSEFKSPRAHERNYITKPAAMLPLESARGEIARALNVSERSGSTVAEELQEGLAFAK